MWLKMKVVPLAASGMPLGLLERMLQYTLVTGARRVVPGKAHNALRVRQVGTGGLAASSVPENSKQECQLRTAQENSGFAHFLRDAQ